MKFKTNLKLVKKDILIRLTKKHKGQNWPLCFFYVSNEQGKGINS